MSEFGTDPLTPNNQDDNHTLLYKLAYWAQQIALNPGGGVTIPDTTNLLAGDGSGGVADSGIVVADVTTQGNSFNDASKLVQLNSSTQYPALDGSLITKLPCPIVLKAGVFTVGTSGSPADLGSVAVPSWITRYYIVSAGSCLLAVTASGTLASATFNLFDQAAGAGTQLLNANVTGPTAVNLKSNAAGALTPTSTSSSIFVRQIADSANAGTVSFYIVIIPLI